MAFRIDVPTRHTDTFAGTPFVHAGVLLALTELAYDALETHLAFEKPKNVIAVQRETRAIYHAPLRWEEGATIEVTTTTADARGFAQEFDVRSTASGRAIALFVHQWAWLDTATGRSAPIPADICERLLSA